MVYPCIGISACTCEYRKRGHFRWDKLSLYPQYMDFRSNTFAVALIYNYVYTNYFIQRLL